MHCRVREATLGAHGIHGEGAAHAAHELRRLREAAELATQYGLNCRRRPRADLPKRRRSCEIKQITEFNIGHNIIARAIFVWIENAVREMKRGYNHEDNIDQQNCGSSFGGLSAAS